VQATNKAISLIKEFEGLKLQAYVCPAGVITIGYGHTKGVKKGDIIDPAQAEAFLKQDLSPIENTLNSKFSGIAQSVFDALVCFSFNQGTAWIRGSGLSTALREGRLTDAADELLRWNKAGGKVLAGLTRRRIAERELFLSGIRRGTKV
jgi:lysozyme